MVASILLVGYGATGIVYSYILEKGRQARVTAVARSNFVTANNGVMIKSARFGTLESFRPFRVVNAIDDVIDEPYDYVVVTTKAIPEIMKTSEVLAPFFSHRYIHDLPVFVLVQNGLGVEKDLYDKITAMNRGPPKIISAAVWILTNMISSGEIEHGMEAKLGIGAYRPDRAKRDTPDEQSMLYHFSRLVESGGGSCMVCEEIQSVKFGKNMWNATYAAFSALTRTPPTAFFGDETVSTEIVQLIRAALDEIVAVGRAMDFGEDALPYSHVETGIAMTKSLYSDPGNSQRPSMLLDVENGRPFELEAVVGEIVKTGRELGVSMPRMETIYALLVVIQHRALTDLGSSRAGNVSEVLER